MSLEKKKQNNDAIASSLHGKYSLYRFSSETGDYARVAEGSAVRALSFQGIEWFRSCTIVGRQWKGEKSKSAREKVTCEHEWADASIGGCTLDDTPFAHVYRYVCLTNLQFKCFVYGMTQV